MRTKKKRLSLLEQAKKLAVYKAPTDPMEYLTWEHIELIIAYFNGEITSGQANPVLKETVQANFPNWFGPALKIAYQRGLIDIVKKTK